VLQLTGRLRSLDRRSAQPLHWLSLRPGPAVFGRGEESPLAWFRRKVFQPCEPGRWVLIMYLPTVDSLTWIPSINSSPWILGAPHSGLSEHMRRIRVRTSRSIRGRPLRRQDFQRQYARKPRRCQRSTVSGLTMMMASNTDGKSRYSHIRTGDRCSAAEAELTTGGLAQQLYGARRESLPHARHEQQTPSAATAGSESAARASRVAVTHLSRFVTRARF
jgi:hypothetical protein